MKTAKDYLKDGEYLDFYFWGGDNLWQICDKAGGVIYRTAEDDHPRTIFRVLEARALCEKYGLSFEIVFNKHHRKYFISVSYQDKEIECGNPKEILAAIELINRVLKAIS